jgi:lysophospholipase L1-like esterase
LSALVGLSAASDAPRLLPADREAAVLYVALGDSTVAGVGASTASHTYVSHVHRRLRDVYPQARVVNLGVSGATSADVLARQLPVAVKLAPHLVTLSIGPNDITGKVSVERYERNIDATLHALTHETDAVVVVNLLPDLAVTRRFKGGGHEAAVAKLTVRFNAALAERGRRYGVELVDLYGPSQREVPANPGLLAGDGYHPSDDGYARWAELMWTGLEARMPRPGQARPPTP